MIIVKYLSLWTIKKFHFFHGQILKGSDLQGVFWEIAFELLEQATNLYIHCEFISPVN